MAGFDFKLIVVRLVMAGLLTGLAVPALAQNYICPTGPGPGEIQVGMTPGGNGVGSVPVCMSNGSGGSPASGPTSPPLPPASNKYGAISFGVNSQGRPAGYYATGAPTAEEARRNALRRCQSRGSRKCRVEAVYVNACVSIATDAGGRLYASKPMNCLDDKAIDRNALARCRSRGGRNCSIFTYLSSFQ